jgi:uncharacterized protein YjhX (UPF0386 family)
MEVAGERHISDAAAAVVATDNANSRKTRANILRVGCFMVDGWMFGGVTEVPR